MAIARWVCMVFAAAMLFGCGYQFEGSSSILPPDVKRVYIPLTENSSNQAGLTTLVTEAMREQFERYGVVTVVDDLGEADAVLKTRILKVKRATGTVTSNTDLALQLDTTMTMAAELKRVTGPLLWKNDSIEVRTTYGLSSNVVVTSSSDFAGGSLAGSDIAALQSSGSREVARGQERGAFNTLAEQAAKIVYDSSVAADF